MSNKFNFNVYCHRMVDCHTQNDRISISINELTPIIWDSSMEGDFPLISLNGTVVLSAVYLILFVCQRIMNSLSILAITLLLSCAATQEIVDYSHTASIQTTGLDSKKYDITIAAPQLNSRLLDFPEACSRNRDLFTSQIIERDRVPLGSQEEFLGLIKANMTAFLRLAERIKTLRSYLAEEALELPTGTESYPIGHEQVEELRELENGLLGINTTIEKKVTILSELIFSEINRTKDSGFNELRLNFEYSSYEARLRYLEDLKKKGKQPKDGERSKVNEYFQEVNSGFDFQKQNLKRLDELLQGFARHSTLKLKITNEMKKLQAKNHIINNKEECRLKNVKPINDDNAQHIQHITHKLRQLKKIESSNREHCEGVALKLLTQIKKVLKAYNYSHTCSEGLDDLKVEKKEIEEKLKDLENQYKDMEYDPTFKKIQGYFNQTRSEKEELIQKIQTFDMNLYTLNPSIIDDEISSIRDKLRAIRYQLEHPPEGEVKPFDNQRVKESVRKINELQHKYCQLKDQYEERYRQVEKAVRKYEFRVGEAVAKNQEYVRRANELRGVQRQFNELRGHLLSAIQ